MEVRKEITKETSGGAKMFVVTPDMGNDTCKKSMIHPLPTAIKNCFVSLALYHEKKRNVNHEQFRLGVLGEGERLSVSPMWNLQHKRCLMPGCRDGVRSSPTILRPFHRYNL